MAQPFTFTEEDFAPKSQFDFTEDDFEEEQPKEETASPVKSEDAFTQMVKAKGGPQTLAQYMKESNTEAIGTAEPLLTKSLIAIPHPSQETVKRLLSLPASLARQRMEETPEETVETPEGPTTVAPKQPVLEKIAGVVPSDKTVAVATGVTHAAADMASFFTSPLGITTLGIGALPAALQRTVALGFAAQMAKDVPEIARQLGDEFGKPEDQRDYEKIAKLSAEAIATTGFVAGSLKYGAAEPIARGLGALPSERPAITPGQLAEQSFREQPKTPVTELVTQPKETYAAEKGIEPKSREPEHQQTGEGGLSTAPSSRDQPQPATRLEEEAQVSLKPAETPIQNVLGMSGADFSKFSAKEGNRGLTEKAYELATTVDDPAILDEAKATSTQQATEAKSKIASAPTPEAKMDAMNDALALGMKRQYFDEAAKMVRALKEVKEGKSVAEAAKDRGVAEQQLNNAVKGISRGLEIKQLPIPERFDTLDDLLKFKEQRRQEEIKLYQSEIGLNQEQAERLQGIMARDGSTDRFERSLSLDVREKLNDFFENSPYNKIGGPFEFWDYDNRYRPEDLQDATKEDLARGLIQATQHETIPSPTSDRFIYSAVAAQKLKQMGATKSDLARELDKYTTRNSGSQGDKIELFKIAGKKLNDFLKTQGIDLPEGELAKKPSGKGLQLTQPVPKMGETGFINLQPLQDLFKATGEGVKKAFNFTKDVAKEVSTLEKSSDYRKSVLNWSAKLQRSFGEAARIQSDIQSKVKDPIRRDAITNWIQANGDAGILRQQASGSKNARLRAGYEAALNLTPDELAIANQVRQQFAALERRGQRYDVLNSHRDNYVNQIWDLGKGPTGTATGRTLKQKFRFSKARTFPNFFVGEQAGYVPKTKDISKLLPIYMHEMENVIAARELVEEMSKGTASDGRPLVAARGVGVPVGKPSGDKATLIFPKISEAETKDYRVLQNQPALEGWRWAAKDDLGNNIFLKADLALHPEAYNRLKNVLGKSIIKEWYQTPTTSVMAIPKALVKGIDMANSEVKKTMLGVLSPFHQVQEATHAIGHRVNPTFSIPEIDLVRNRDQMDAAQHGLMLQPDRASSEQFMEGFKQSKIIGKIPGVGPASEFYSNYLFNKYIPGLKYKTYQAILDRNMNVYKKDLAANKVSPDDVKILSAEQANAAYGHLNYADLGRNPTIQHLAQLGILAPDFFESRIRFAGQAVKGATGLKVGREQLLALATLAIAQATLAYVSAQLTGGQWDKKRPFEMTKDGKRYSMRSIPEDIQKFMEDPRRFLHNRLSILGKAGLQYGFGVNYRGQKVTTGETTKELAQMPIPLMARPLLGIGDQSGWEQLLSAAGLKVSKSSPRSDILERARQWGESSSNPKIKFQFEQRAKESLPDSVYKPVRQAIEANDKDKIIATVKEILAREPDQESKVKRMKRLLTDFQPFTENDVKPFATPSKEAEKQFVRSLNSEGKALYQQAIKEQVQQYLRLTQAIYGTPRMPPMPERYRNIYGQSVAR